MIQSHKKNPTLIKNYDTIIIGSGMGSLTTAAILAKEGQKVLVLERHYTAGGFTHVFKRKGFEWDVGIHYIGEVQRPTSVIKKLFDYISDSKLLWADMGEVYDKIIIGDKEAAPLVTATLGWSIKIPKSAITRSTISVRDRASMRSSIPCSRNMRSWALNMATA